MITRDHYIRQVLVNIMKLTYLFYIARHTAFLNRTLDTQEVKKKLSRKNPFIIQESS